MSVVHVTTGRVAARPCDLCGAPVEHKESQGLYGTTGLYGDPCWSAVSHDAPCGAPCLGGGVGREARERLKPVYAHWIDGVHGHMDDGVRVCPNGCAFDKET